MWMLTGETEKRGRKQGGRGEGPTHRGAINTVRGGGGLGCCIKPQ